MTTTPSPPPPTSGVPFGRYVIRTRLGRGGMGEVFLADQLGPLGPVRPVALKRLLPRYTGDPGVVRLFLEEMATAAQLSHPNIAITYDFGEVDGVYFMAMEYVDGLPMDQLIRIHGPLPVDATVALASAVARALQHAHDRQAAGVPAPVVHQDVTPHNVIVSRGGEAKLLDFGIARTEDAARTGRLRAKVRYAAPEQLRGQSPDRRFDIWGLAVTLYQGLTGKLPFPQSDLPARLLASERGEYEPLDSLAPHAAALAPAIHRGLAPDPAARFATVAAFADALQQAHPVGDADGRKTLSDLVAQVAAAPATLDGGELTSTGLAVDAPGLLLRPDGGEPPSTGLAVDAPGPLLRPDGGEVSSTGLAVDAPGPLPRHDGGEIDATGLALDAPGPWLRPANLPASAPVADVPPSPRGPSFPDDGPTRVTLKTPAEPAPTPRRGAAWAIAGGLALGGVATLAALAMQDPAGVAEALEPPPPITQVRLLPPSEAGPESVTAAETDAGAPLAPDAGAPAPADAGVERAPPKPEPPPTRRRANRRRAAKAARKPVEVPEPSTTPTPDPARTLGLLSVRTVPWARVFVDGRPLGEGIIARRALSVGAHVLRLEAGEGEHEPREVRIEIRGGQTTRVFLDFAQNELRVAEAGPGPQ